MNVALLFYGKPLYINNNDIHKNLKEKILDKYNTDNFCHLLFSYSNNNDKIPYNSINIVQEKYKPNHLEIFNPELINTDVKYNIKNISKNDASDYLKDMYSIQCVARMLKKWMEYYKKDYDIIILLKYNKIINEFIDLSKLDMNKIYSINNKLDESFLIFNKKFFDWSLNIYDDILKNELDKYIELYKYDIFNKRFDSNDIINLQINIKNSYFKNIKIAHIIFGQPRFIDNFIVYDKYKKEIYNKYDTDIYCHIWFSDDKNKEYPASTWTVIQNNNNLISPNTVDIIKYCYNPINYEIDEPRYFNIDENQKNNLINKNKNMNDLNMSNMLSQLFSIQRVSKLIDKNKNYDYIIASRYDTDIIEIPQDLSILSKDKLYLSNIHDRFPDPICIHGTKFLEWQQNIYNDAYKVMENPSGTCPESYKKDTFIVRHNISDVVSIGLNTNYIRSI